MKPGYLSSINTEPEQGWTRYEPVAFSAGDQNQALPLSTLTGSGKHPAATRLNPVSRERSSSLSR